MEVSAGLTPGARPLPCSVAPLLVMAFVCPVAPTGREVVREEGARSQAGLARWLEYEDANFALGPNGRGCPWASE